MALQTANQFNLTPNATGAFNQGVEQGAKLKNQFITEPKLQQLTKAAASGDKQALIDLQAKSPERANQFQRFKGNEQSLESGAQDMERKKLEDRTRSVINGALEVQQIQDPKAKLMALKKRKIQLLDEGKETQDTDEAIALYEAGDIDGGNALIDNVVELGVRHGIISPKQQGKGFSLSAGQTRFDSRGNEIASVGASEQQKQTINIREQEAKLRAATLEDKKLERLLKIETNELKKQELQTKLEENKIKQAQEKRDIKFNAQSSIDAVSNSVGTIDKLLSGGGLESAAGIQANFPTIAGSDASDFEATLETLQSQAFLSQVEKMKGLGALSENEGKKLGAALGTLNINQSDKSLRRELGRVRDTLLKAEKSMKNKFGVSKQKTGKLNADEIAELQQLREELGQ